MFGVVVKPAVVSSTGGGTFIIQAQFKYEIKKKPFLMWCAAVMLLCNCTMWCYFRCLSSSCNSLVFFVICAATTKQMAMKKNTIRPFRKHQNQSQTNSNQPAAVRTLGLTLYRAVLIVISSDRLPLARAPAASSIREAAAKPPGN